MKAPDLQRGRTPLHDAISKDKTELARLLMDGRADINAKAEVPVVIVSKSSACNNPRV